MKRMKGLSIPWVGRHGHRHSFRIGGVQSPHQCVEGPTGFWTMRTSTSDDWSGADKPTALIVEMDMHDGFWIFGMGGVFGGSLDFLHRPVSYTPARTQVDGDGVVRFIITHDDPGLANWLDTQGFTHGNLTYRNLLKQNSATFRTRLVKRAELLSALPAETAKMDAAERAAEMQRRYHSVKLRFGL